jgi:hypothetical protein
VTWLFTFTDSRARERECVYIIRTSMGIQYANPYFMYTPVMCLDFFRYSVYLHYLTYIFLHFHVCMSMPIDVTHTRRHLATDVCLTVSSLRSTESFMSTATSCRSCQPAYFPGLNCLRECMCVTWLCAHQSCVQTFSYSVYSHYFTCHSKTLRLRRGCV